MRAHNVQEVLDVDILVEGSHAVRERAINTSLYVAIAPEPGVGAAEADNGLWPETAQLLDVLLHDAKNFAIGVDPRGQIAIDFFDGGFRIRLHDRADCRHHLLLGDTEGETDIGFEGGARW